MTSRPVLIAQHDSQQSAELARILAPAGFACEVASDGSAVLRKAVDKRCALVLLDSDIRREKGSTICSLLRQNDGATPVMFVASSSNVEDKLSAFRSGADDYIVRPFINEELLLRIEAVLRRSHPQPSSSPQCRIGPSLVDFRSGLARRDDAEVSLTARELDLLRYLCERPHRVVTRDELLREVWRYNSTGTRTIDVHIATLRQKLEHDARRPRHLITVRRRGYRFDE